MSTGTDAQRNASETATPAPSAQSDPSSSVPHARVDTDTNTPSPAPTPIPDAAPSPGQPDPSHSINTASESAAPTQESNGPAAQTPSPDRGNDPSTATDPRTQVQQPTTTAMPAGTPTPTDTSSPASTSTSTTPGSIPSASTGAHTGSDSPSRTSSSPTFHSQSATATEAHAPTRPAPTANPTPTGDPNATTPTPNQTPNVAPTATPGPVTNTPTNTPTTPTQGPSRQPTPTTNPRTDTPRTEAPQRTTPTPTRREPTTPSTPRPNTPTNNRPGTTNPNPNTPNQPGLSSTPTPNQTPNQAPNQPANQGPNQTPNPPTNQGPSQTPNQVPSHTPNQPANQTPNQAPTQVPIQTPNNNPGAQQPSSNGHPAQESSDTTPPKPDQPAPLSQGQSLQQIRDSLNHAPYGLLTPDPAHQQALQDAVPRNEDGTPQRHPDPNGEWAQLQNDGGLQQPGRSNNCLDNARAGLSTWFGNPQVSAPRTPDKNHDGTLDTMSPERDSYNNLDAWAGRPQIWAGADHPGPYARIAHHLQEAGPGSAAVVGVQWPGGGGHAFNVYNHNGQIIWVDHQTGEVSPNPIHTGAAGVRYVPFDSNGQTMDAPWEKQSETEGQEGQEQGQATTDGNQTPTEHESASQTSTASPSHDAGGPAPGAGQTPYGASDPVGAGHTPSQQEAIQQQAAAQEHKPDYPQAAPAPTDHPRLPPPETVDSTPHHGMLPMPDQQNLRQTNDVRQVGMDHVLNQLDSWLGPVTDGYPDGSPTPRRPLVDAMELVRAANQEGPPDQDGASGQDGTPPKPKPLSKAELARILPGFENMHPGEQGAVVASLARLSHNFHTAHGVGVSPEADPNHPAHGAAAHARAGWNAGHRQDDVLKAAIQEEYQRSGVAGALRDAGKHRPDFTGRNYAVIEVRDPITGESTYLVDSSYPNRTGEKGKHSEENVLDYLDHLNSQRERGERYTVDGLFTDREPCGFGAGHANCSRMLSNRIPGVDVYYGTGYRKNAEVVEGDTSSASRKKLFDQDLARNLERLGRTWVGAMATGDLRVPPAGAADPTSPLHAPPVSPEPPTGGSNPPEYGSAGTTPSAAGQEGPEGIGSNGDEGTGLDAASEQSGHSEPPMERGGSTEQELREAIKEIPGKQRPKPDVLERALERLASEPGGQRVAEAIAAGNFSRSEGFGQVVSSLGARKEAMFQPGADQILFGDELVRSGVPAQSIEFEYKIPVGADADIRITDESGAIYTYQMKHLNNPLDEVSEITRGKYLLQLARTEADHRIMLVDGGSGTCAEWISNGSHEALMDIHNGGGGPKGEGITFVVRLSDGTLVIPPGAKTDPKDML